MLHTLLPGPPLSSRAEGLPQHEITAKLWLAAGSCSRAQAGFPAHSSAARVHRCGGARRFRMPVRAARCHQLTPKSTCHAFALVAGSRHLLQFVPFSTSLRPTLARSITRSPQARG